MEQTEIKAFDIPEIRKRLLAAGFKEYILANAEEERVSDHTEFLRFDGFSGVQSVMVSELYIRYANFLEVEDEGQVWEDEGEDEERDLYAFLEALAPHPRMS